MHQHFAQKWVHTGCGPFPVPPNMGDRALQLAQGLARLEDLKLQLATRLIDILDAADGDPDFEPSLGSPEARRPAGWRGDIDQSRWAGGATDDREEEDDTEVELGGLGDQHRQGSWALEGGGEHDGDPDEEPSLGAIETAGGWLTMDQRITWGGRLPIRKYGKPVDIDDVEHDGREPPEDDELPLGWSEGAGWEHGSKEPGAGELGYGEADTEPSLGSLDSATDQRRWSDGGSAGCWGRNLDLEVQCEDEGVDTDSEPDDFHEVGTYASDGNGGEDQSRLPQYSGLIVSDSERRP